MGKTNRVAVILGMALLTAAPAIMAPTVAAAQAGTDAVGSMMTAALTQANADAAGQGDAALATAQSSAIQAATVTALTNGASPAAVLAAALGTNLSASIVAQGITQAVAQIIADPAAPASVKAAARALLQLAMANSQLAAAMADAGIRVSATDGAGSFLIDGAGNPITGNPSGYDPCDNAQGDYC